MRSLLPRIIPCILLSWLAACANPPQLVHPGAGEGTNLTSRPLAIQIVATPRMHQDRAAHSATLLPDGTVLLVGGFTHGEQALASAERFDPATNTFTLAKTMSVARQSHTATLLPNGNVLIAGGYNGSYLKSAELYDPQSGQFTATGEMQAARSGHIAVLLDNGKVLLAGGTGEGWTFLQSAELYDPATGTFSTTGEMAVARESHTATRLDDGQVLITGGHQGRRTNIVIYDSAELYNPASGTFAATATMTLKRHKHDATLHADGRVFISGGSDERDSEGAYRSTEIYDPTSKRFTPTGEMDRARYKHTGTSLRLQDGQVLLLGGANTTEIFNPQSGISQRLNPSIGNTRLFASATLLPNGNVLFAGGYGPDIAAATETWILRLSVQ